MKNLMSMAVAALAIGTWSVEALAKEVAIRGTHSRAEIARKCDAVGGFKDNTAGKSGGYGCWNFSKTTSVTCDAKGHCTGWVPD
jgi:hypothetical protein